MSFYLSYLTSDFHFISLPFSTAFPFLLFDWFCFIIWHIPLTSFRMRSPYTSNMPNFPFLSSLFSFSFLLIYFFYFIFFISFFFLFSSFFTLYSGLNAIGQDLFDPFSATPSSALYSLSRCSYQLERLKQDAMMHCWMSEMSLFDLSGSGEDLFWLDTNYWRGYSDEIASNLRDFSPEFWLWSPL